MGDTLARQADISAQAETLHVIGPLMMAMISFVTWSALLSFLDMSLLAVLTFLAKSSFSSDQS